MPTLSLRRRSHYRTVSCQTLATFARDMAKTAQNSARGCRRRSVMLCFYRALACGDAWFPRCARQHPAIASVAKTGFRYSRLIWVSRPLRPLPHAAPVKRGGCPSESLAASPGRVAWLYLIWAIACGATQPIAASVIEDGVRLGWWGMRRWRHRPIARATRRPASRNSR